MPTVLTVMAALTAYVGKALKEMGSTVQVWNKCFILIMVTTMLCLFADIPECERELDDCDPNANCTNTFGSYDCNCNTGFTGDGFNCSG